jgi:hypothetical protein
MTVSDRVLEVLHDTNRLERAGDDLGGSDTLSFVGQLGFEQFRVGQDDTELIVQPMEQADDFGGHGVRGAR